ncbi:DUF397 domain-containing protein [Actinomadura darangshiensis]|uniref:DUF397 domain-containing protein n=1 Tax=Actinomadura darangshiensis TaxID=705336 RepID=A0A4R5A379_9ACTN|nr:DUF397 domain-containing protein [Actinomadura darangshiensis]TDD65440.1 DUF397 domain-containing protein [Actinomadura darangshiensis]
MWDVNVTRWRKSSHSDSSGGSCVEVGSVVPVRATQWQKSSHSDSSGAECVDVAAVSPVDEQWRKSSSSDSSGGACVEVADLAAAVAVRDSKDPDGPKLVFGPSAWQAFASQVKNGVLDLT